MSLYGIPEEAWPDDPDGSLVPVLEASIEAAKKRHPSGKGESVETVVPTFDPCDRCGHAAAYRVGKFDENDRPLDMALNFCGHHFRKIFPPMADQGWAVIGGNPEEAAKA